MYNPGLDPRSKKAQTGKQKLVIKGIMVTTMDIYMDHTLENSMYQC